MECIARQQQAEALLRFMSESSRPAHFSSGRSVTLLLGLHPSELQRTAESANALLPLAFADSEQHASSTRALIVTWVTGERLSRSAGCQPPRLRAAAQPGHCGARQSPTRQQGDWASLCLRAAAIPQGSNKTTCLHGCVRRPEVHVRVHATPEHQTSELLLWPVTNALPWRLLIPEREAARWR